MAHADARTLRVLLLGTINRDQLLFADSSGRLTRQDSLGGACYSLLALKALLPAARLNARLLAGLDLTHELTAILAGSGNAPGEVLWRDRASNRVELDCRDPEHKRERSWLTVGGYTLDECPAGPWDAVLLNFTSGREFSLRGWSHWRRILRDTARPPFLQLDLHSLSLDARAGRARRLRPLHRWQEWLRDLDLLQLTLDECACLAPHSPLTLADTGDLLGELHGLGIGEIVITDAARGFMHSRPGMSRHWPALEARVVDSTGSGDVLGAALLAGTLCGLPDELRLARARQAATLNLSLCGPEQLDRLARL